MIVRSKERYRAKGRHKAETECGDVFSFREQVALLDALDTLQDAINAERGDGPAPRRSHLEKYAEYMALPVCECGACQSRKGVAA